MRALLLTDMYRIKKSGTFRTTLLLVFLLNILLLWIRYDRHTTLDEGLWALIALIGCAQSILIPSIMGSNIEDGTIRNKLIIGKSRQAIYASNMIIAQGMMLVLLAVSLLVQIGIGTFILASPASLGNVVMIVLVANIALSAWYVMICAWCSNKTKSVIICMISLIVFFLIAFAVQGRLSEPPETMIMESATNGEFENRKIANERYVTGTLRICYEHLMSLLPSGAMMQLAMGMWCPQWILIVYEMIWSIVCAVIGMIGFQKKSIR